MEKKPNVEHLKVFGNDAFAHKPKEQKSKLDSKNIPSLLVGYVSKFYIVWIMFKRQLCISRNVLVVESSSHFQTTNPTNGIHDNEDQQNNKDF